MQFVYGFIAICGGIARYLNNYATGATFRLSIFLASAFVAGFSGWMFALIGVSMSFDQPITFAMAGMGGFMGEQTLKFVWELIQHRVR